MMRNSVYGIRKAPANHEHSIRPAGYLPLKGLQSSLCNSREDLVHLLHLALSWGVFCQ